MYAHEFVLSISPSRVRLHNLAAQEAGEHGAKFRTVSLSHTPSGRRGSQSPESFQTTILSSRNFLLRTDLNRAQRLIIAERKTVKWTHPPHCSDTLD